MLKSTPEIQVFVEPRSNIPQRRIDAWVVADMLGDLLAPTASTAGVVVRGNTGGNWSDWQGLSNGLRLVNVGFARFLPSGEVSYSPGQGAGRAGFYVLPRALPFDSEVPGRVLGVQGNLPLQWIPDAGSVGNWQTVPSLTPRQGGGGAGIYNAGNQSNDKEFRVTTKDPLPANRSLQFDLDFLIQSRGGPLPYCRIGFGRDFAFALRHGMPPALERVSMNPETGQFDYRTLRTLDAVGPVNLRGGQYLMAVKHLDGRLVWDCNGHSVWMHDATEPDEHGEVKALYANWTKAPLVVTGMNTLPRIEVAALDQGDQGSDGPTGATGTVIRRIARTLKSDQQNLGTTPFAGGWQRNDTDMPVTVTPGEDYVEYSATLTCSPDGIHTPFLTSILLSYAPVWTQPIASSIDISRAVTGASINLAAPPIQAGSEGTLDVDRGILEKITNGIAYTQDYCPIAVKARWRDPDGTPGTWRGLFRGYLYGQTRSSPGFNRKVTRHTLRDPIVRLRDPAGKIDHKFRPMGLLLMERLKAAIEEQNGNGGYDKDGRVIFNTGPLPVLKLFGGECVQEILRIELGPNAANQLNGDGNPLRFFDTSHPPLLSTSDVMGAYLPLAAALNQTLNVGGLDGIPIPPPFDSDCLGWINKFGDDEFATFFYGYVDRNTDGYPVPIYGRYLNYLDRALLWNITDALQVSADVDYLMLDAQSETRPESDINRILVWADLGSGQKNPLLPAMRMAEARLPASDANSDIYSWARTKIIKNNIGFYPGAAELIASIALQQIAGLKKQWPRIKFRGDSAVQVGDVIRPRMVGAKADVTMAINGKTFRATTITHDFTFGTSGSDWTTTAGLRPLARIEDIRFRNHNNLPIPSDWFG